MKKLRTSNGKAQEHAFVNCIICISIFLSVGNLYYSFTPTLLISAPSFTYVLGNVRNKEMRCVYICAKPTVSLYFLREFCKEFLRGS